MPAVEEVDAAGGVPGRALRPIPVDGGAAPSRVADEVEAPVAACAVRGVTGRHISSVRRALTPGSPAGGPTVCAAPYEGGENTRGVHPAGETPDGQLAPTMRLLVGERRARRRYVVGNDYVRPCRTVRAARACTRAARRPGSAARAT
ncbi:ABC transporter substrate-binding protein [Streptomyces sp. ST2-7A]|uniref:ABC transporter substrate-binding protein n=1 Tax=Streptomyces sp. ST2-7A TaxID=2907214 RepID=UPI001F39EC82|nr:ABC transporter substrate-binding protein [Streptomyces sp. ST2-7A]MCE7080757.1 transporter substrate-binding protein [Streptomyces sp. ST2-7A]